MVNKRKIKFRVWDKLAKHMIYPNSHMSMDLNGNVYNLQNGAGGTDYELMQFTELKDKNGKEIYEGDILGRENEIIDGEKIPNSEYPFSWWERAVVIYYPKFARFGLEFYSPYGREGYTGLELHISEFIKNEYYVVGNIFENSELLKNE